MRRVVNILQLNYGSKSNKMSQPRNNTLFGVINLMTGLVLLVLMN